jgi:hypothetical protein
VEDGDFIRVSLLDYADLDFKPIVMQFKDVGNSQAERETVKHIEPTGLQEALCQKPSTGEYELLDALNLMIRGDYSSAVRRITTAIEVVLESSLRAELLKLHPPAEVEQKLQSSRNDFPGRLRQYEKLSGHEMPAELTTDLDRTRNLRHEIVHRGRRLLFQERGTAQRAVDTGRWIFNRLENNPDRVAVREKNVAFRSLGKHRHLMDSFLTPDGAVVSVMGWPQEPSHDEIAVAAYFLWERNARQQGKQLDNWLAAEKELRTARWQNHQAAVD